MVRASNSIKESYDDQISAKSPVRISERFNLALSHLPAATPAAQHNERDSGLHKLSHQVCVVLLNIANRYYKDIII